MEEYNKSEVSISLPRFGPGEIVAAIGFLTMIVSNFFSFAPIEEKTWREIGVGFPVMFACGFGIAMVLVKNYFASFFIGMFSAFFITHEIIICYDNKAVEMGREIGENGWFRLVAMIFSDALNPSYGAFWAVMGVCLALAAITISWLKNIALENKALAKAAEATCEEQEETEEDGSCL
ncbi:MAG: hypothetical protein Kow0029_31850 [Candidatus Rifleibacteriota bacterium]